MGTACSTRTNCEGHRTHDTVLVLAGAETTATIERACHSRALHVRTVATVAEATALLQQPSPPIRAIVAALGMGRSTFLFNEGCGDRSDLITLALQTKVPVIVFSHTACDHPAMAAACFDAGAAAVVASEELLEQEVRFNASLCKGRVRSASFHEFMCHFLVQGCEVRA